MCHEPKVFKLRDLPPGGRCLFPPQEGWEANTLYLVEVAYSKVNLIHQAYLIVGFLDDKGMPGSYSQIFTNTYSRPYDFREFHYLRIVKKLHTRGESA
jgi:hypothetical protein